MSEWAQIITAVGGLIIAMGTCTATVLAAMRQTNRKVDDVMNEVATLNESTIGQLAAAIETVRIETKEARGGHLTSKEQRHIDAAETSGGSL